MFKIFKTYFSLFELNVDDFDFCNDSIENSLTSTDRFGRYETYSSVPITRDFCLTLNRISSVNDLNSLVFATRANDVTMYYIL